MMIYLPRGLMKPNFYIIFIKLGLAELNAEYIDQSIYCCAL